MALVGAGRGVDASLQLLDSAAGRCTTQIPQLSPPPLYTPAADGVGHMQLGGLAEQHRILVVAPDSKGSTWDFLRDGFGPDVAYINAALQHVFRTVGDRPALPLQHTLTPPAATPQPAAPNPGCSSAWTPAASAAPASATAPAMP